MLMLPCPFCGSDDILIDHCEEDCCGAKPRFVSCQCGCELGGRWDNDKEAIAAWNNRFIKWPVVTEEMFTLSRERAEALFDSLTASMNGEQDGPQ